MPNWQQFSLGLVPITPVPFTDSRTAAVAWVRLGLYGGIAAMTWGKSRTVSYVALGALGLSLVTSLGADAVASLPAPASPPELEVQNG